MATSTMTISGVARSYEPRWHEAYSKDIAKGDTSVELCEIPNGESIVRTSHAVTKEIEKHYRSVEDVLVDSDGSSKIRKVGLTITFEKGNPVERSAALDLADGFLTSQLENDELGGLIAGVLKR